MSCVRAILPKIGFMLSLVTFSYIFLSIYVYDRGSLLIGIILVLTSSFLILTFAIIQYLQCHHNKTSPEPKESSGTFEQDKQCFMKLWNAGKTWHWVAKGIYYGTLMPVILFIACGLFLGIAIYFASGILIFYLIFKYCAGRKERRHAQKAKYESDSQLDASSHKK